MEQDRNERLAEKRQKRRRRRLVLKMICLALLLIGMLFLIAYNVFTVKKVVVKGNEHYSNEQIEKFVLSDEYSWNSLYVMLKYQFFPVVAVPFVEEMEITLKNPHTLNVHVYEKGMIGCLYISSIGQYAYFDTDGFVVETSKEVIGDVPQIEGLDCSKVVLYEKLPIKNEKILKNLLTLTRALKKEEIPPEKICFHADGDMSLYYGQIEVLLGDSESLTQKIQRLPYILPQLSGKTGVLHVENWTENTTDIIFDETK